MVGGWAGEGCGPHSCMTLSIVCPRHDHPHKSPYHELLHKPVWKHHSETKWLQICPPYHLVRHRHARIIWSRVKMVWVTQTCFLRGGRVCHLMLSEHQGQLKLSGAHRVSAYCCKSRPGQQCTLPLQLAV